MKTRPSATQAMFQQNLLTVKFHMQSYQTVVLTGKVLSEWKTFREAEEAEVFDATGPYPTKGSLMIMMLDQA